MTRTLLAIAAVLGCAPAATSSAPATAPPGPRPETPPATTGRDAAPRVSAVGYGALHFGMDRAALSAVLGERLAADDGCVVITPAAAGSPPRYALMLERGQLVRIDVLATEITSDTGLHLGSTAAELRTAHPTERREDPAKYDPHGHTFVVGPPERSHLVFEVDADDRVTSWRAGLAPQVDYVERCG